MNSKWFTLAAVLCSSIAMAKGVEVSEVYARPTIQGMKQGGVFLNLKNTDQKDNTLIAASISPRIAERVELHTHINDNGVMRMREVKGGIPIPAGETVELKPGSYHVMFFGLKKPLKAGDQFPITLTFKNGDKKTSTVKVRDMQQTGKHHHHNHEHEHEHEHEHHHH